ncbi:hypothetical protein AK830_g11461 [Neonectria ditissima]|uniref:Mid2 domain-containing protein n=1 Tax=Neonectria ditissima TaxID=78410 RepID=A0A0P7B509_9HYPO|nr:hypothetical protein AK830_g11461 [Neonectria ditissima]
MSRSSHPAASSSQASTQSSEPRESSSAPEEDGKDDSKDNEFAVSIGVGLGVGGAVLLSCLAAFWLWHRRRRNSRQPLNQSGYRKPPEAHLQAPASNFVEAGLYPQELPTTERVSELEARER